MHNSKAPRTPLLEFNNTQLTFCSTRSPIAWPPPTCTTHIHTYIHKYVYWESKFYLEKQQQRRAIFHVFLPWVADCDLVLIWQRKGEHT